MATKKKDDTVVRLQHLNGATVTVSADRAEALVAGGLFSAPARSTAKSDK
jgi:hypothetical protein